ncbi:amidohydrolase [Natranaerobius trueperi]|uniref:Amidohydrolase n=2 Tax=Natranaerobius trueperi TaxID=759412 RepID=A0A226BV11_9FIRM|nr:amidohydrolase [Natranaerobius trueperi]
MIDGTGKSEEHGVVIVIENGKIVEVGTQVSIPKEAKVKDMSGKTVIPGIIDSHVHLTFKPCADPFSTLLNESDSRTVLKSSEHASKTLRSGVTTVRDLGGKNYVDLDLRDAINVNEAIGPTMLAAGKPIVMTGGHGWPIAEEVDSPDEARKAARNQLKKGVDIVKIMATGGVMTEGVEPGSPQLSTDEMAPAIEEAHKAGKTTASHAQGTTGIKNAINAGIDSIEHGIYLDEEAITMMKDNGIYFVPTLSAPYWISKKGKEANIPEHAVKKSDASLKAHRESFKMALEAGVKIAMGTDAGTPFNYHGYNFYELVLMVENGMSPLEAIKAGTQRSAELLNISDQVGTITPGKDADLIVLDDNPLDDIYNLEKIYQVFKKGDPVK